MKWVSRFRLLRAWWLCIFTFIQQELKVHDILFLFYFNGFNRFILSFYCSLYLYRGCQECANLWGRNEWFCSCWFSSMSLALDTDIGHKPISKYSVRLGSNVRTAGRCHKFGHGCTLTTSSRLTNSYLFARQPVYQVQETNQSVSTNLPIWWILLTMDSMFKKAYYTLWYSIGLNSPWAMYCNICTMFATWT